MPGLIAVSEFVEETREDYNSPTTSTFVSRMPQCRQTITSLEEVNLFAWFPFLNESNRIFSYFASPNVTLQKFWSVVERVFQCVGVSQSLHGYVLYIYDINVIDVMIFWYNTHYITILTELFNNACNFYCNFFALHIYQFPHIDDVNIAYSRFAISSLGNVRRHAVIIEFHPRKVRRK